MTKKVNLDALIPREDFEINEEQESVGTDRDKINIKDIEIDSFFFPALRKPDFQRETNEWEIDKIAKLIKSFLDGDLIPAIILWKNPYGTIFVIDGSHRLSALGAWVNDDYGDGMLSNKFYQNKISNEQLEIAEDAREHINKNIQSYDYYKQAAKNPSRIDSLTSKRAKNLGSLSVQLQWVKGNADKAEDSFFNINQQASPINKTELTLLKSRKKPNSLATRAIIRSGTGHKYWSKFEKSKQQKIESIANNINKILFDPRYQTPIRSLDLPLGGNRISSQTLTYDLVNITNMITNASILKDDNDGDDTIDFLTKCRKVCWLLNSCHASSLGLHPIIYCYSLEGRHKPASFYSMAALGLDMLDNEVLKKEFISVREKFEEILLNYSYLVQQIVQENQRLAVNSFNSIKVFYMALIKGLSNGKNAPDLIIEILKEKRFNRLKIKGELDVVTSNKKDFSTDIKSNTFIKNAIPGLQKCSICKGFLHKNSITMDHKIRKREGGTGSLDNADLAHPYCNSTIKN
ncbi:HNH endonuclease family protein [Candidatus Nitrosocosmicus hydrocola]|uniref:HNH endonuclease family protein n=1 Tax=Candidatus Nitrosocosmicus hydrocola TaxID=1826872 RepID=UPI000A8689DB|nr:DUF262 domain-containing protein [Candidatus Nitrosocosmicus hydrocola]